MIATVEFPLDKIYVRFSNTVYRQIVGIPIGTNCAPIIADLFLYCYQLQFNTKIQTTQNRIDGMFNNTLRSLDDVLALNNPEF